MVPVRIYSIPVCDTYTLENEGCQMSDLKDQLIKLGSDNKGLRKHIRPVLAELEKEALGAPEKFHRRIEELESEIEGILRSLPDMEMLNKYPTDYIAELSRSQIKDLQRLGEMAPELRKALHKYQSEYRPV